MYICRTNITLYCIVCKELFWFTRCIQSENKLVDKTWRVIEHHKPQDSMRLNQFNPTDPPPAAHYIINENLRLLCRFNEIILLSIGRWYRKWIADSGKISYSAFRSCLPGALFCTVYIFFFLQKKNDDLINFPVYEPIHTPCPISCNS